MGTLPRCAAHASYKKGQAFEAWTSRSRGLWSRERENEMGVEIERKFLVKSESWRGEGEGRAMIQGYVCIEDQKTVRARIRGNQAWVTIKGPTKGCSRAEFEFEIPVQEAKALLDELAGDRLVRKTRYRIPRGQHVWELDVFEDRNAPLVLAEIELSAEDEAFEKPDWLGPEVTDDGRYVNAYLAEHPYSTWA